jgi:NADPH-dependent curcumin reductase CurA
MVAEYNKADSEKYGIKNLFQVVAKKLTMRGFLVGDKDMGPVYFQERNENVAKWLHEGTFKSKSSITDGIDNGPEGFVGMLQVPYFPIPHWLPWLTSK